MTSRDIREKFRAFFESRSHTWVPSSSLIPDDPSVLLTTAGMQQFKPYYTGALDAQKDFGSLNTASIQKSFRTSDIDEVGDESHLTFFEMMGNFSFGGYWKKEAITYAYEFITKEMGLPISYVTVFEGSDVVPKDTESADIWRSLDPNIKVIEQGMDDVFWGPTGTSGPCGPTTEVYVRNANGNDIEIWNVVFNEFLCNGSREALLRGEAKLTPLTTKGIDTGMGLERLAMVSQGVKNIFETDLFSGLLHALPKDLPDRTKRIIADHVRGSIFLISDGVRPSNKEAGYVLRRLLRRSMTHLYLYHYLGGMGADMSLSMEKLFDLLIDTYSEEYRNLDKQDIHSVFEEEYIKFSKTLGVGLKELARLEKVNASIAFKLFESHGLSYEIVKDLAQEKAKDLQRQEFDEEFKKHQEISRAGQEKKFGGHGLILDTGELKAGSEEELKTVTRLHTATHLLQQALRDVLGSEVQQRGSDITVERTRFDFSFPRKVTPEELARVEKLVNEKIAADLPVQFQEMSKDEAERIGALHFFRERYPERVKVYFVGPSLREAYSKEFCGGPHVTHTGEIGGFRIAKEESVAAGIRRIRGVLAS